MKNQALFSSKHESKKLKCRLLQFLLGALRVNDKRRGKLGASLLTVSICQMSLCRLWFPI